MNLRDEFKAEIKRQYGLLNQKNSMLEKRKYFNEVYRERPPYQRDYSRILYSSAFRRLQGKMQILGVNSAAFFRNRLTHSLEVSQVASSIAEKLAQHCGCESMYSNDEQFIILAAALAHDIGHPAFGHKGEKVLDKIGLELESQLRFEGNAQNFRTIRVLEKKEATIQGLNLTNRTLLAINKYLVCETLDLKDGKPKVKKFLYKPDYEYLEEIRTKTDLLKQRTLDAQIIDLADEIAYAVHDLEDGLALHSFSIDELLYELQIYEKGKLNTDEGYLMFCKMVDDSRKEAFKSDSYKTLQEYTQVFRKDLTSRLTYELINDLTLSQVEDEFAKKHGVFPGNLELRLDKFQQLREALTNVIFRCISREPNIILYEARGEKVIRSLFNLFTAEPRLMSPDYRAGKKEEQPRLVIDFIAGMMDTFAIEQYEMYFNEKFEQISFSEDDLRKKAEKQGERN